MKTGKMNSTLPSHKSCVIDKILKKKGYRISKFSVEASKKCNKKLAWHQIGRPLKKGEVDKLEKAGIGEWGDNKVGYFVNDKDAAKAKKVLGIESLSEESFSEINGGMKDE